MLVLTRRLGEVLWIDDARLIVLDVRDGKVRLGIEAPKHMEIVREEIRPFKRPAKQERQQC